MAQLRNETYIRETAPESRTRVKFCVRVSYKIPIFRGLLSRIFKVLGMYESVIVMIWPLELFSVQLPHCFSYKR